MFYEHSFQANLVRKTASIIRSTRRTWYEKRPQLSGVQGEPCTKNGVVKFSGILQEPKGLAWGIALTTQPNVGTILYGCP